LASPSADAGFKGVTSPLQPLFNAVNGPVEALTGRPLIGNGTNAAPGSGQNGTAGGWLLGDGGGGRLGCGRVGPERRRGAGPQGCWALAVPVGPAHFH